MFQWCKLITSLVYLWAVDLNKKTKELLISRFGVAVE